MIKIDINGHDYPLSTRLHDSTQLNRALYETVAENNFGNYSRLKLMTFQLIYNMIHLL